MSNENEYTPTTEEVHTRYLYFASEMHDDFDAKSAEFDRWLAKVLAEAWDKGLDAGCDRWMDHREFGDPPVNPYQGGGG